MIGVVDVIVESLEAYKNVIDHHQHKNSNFSVKTLDELLSQNLDLKFEVEFIIKTCYIFGENSNEYKNENVENWGIDLARKKLKFNEVVATLAFFRMEVYEEKIKSNKNQN